MMYEELVKRLREAANVQCFIGCFGICSHCKIGEELNHAADAIEELSCQRDRAMKRLCEWCGVCPEDKRDARDCEIAMLDANPERKQTFRSGEEEPGESSSIAAPAAMRSIPPRSDDGGG